MYAADDDSSTLLPASAGIERNAADKAESAARAAASRVTAWLQRSPTGPLARASCADSAPVPASSGSASSGSASSGSASSGSTSSDAASSDAASSDSVLAAAADDASADKTAPPPAKAASDEGGAEASAPALPVATTAD